MQNLASFFRLLDKNNRNTTLDKFFYSINYPLAIALLTLFSFLTKTQMGCYAVFLAIASFLLVRQRDATPILPLLIFFIMMFRDLSVTGNLLFYLMLIPLAICLVLHFIKFPPVPFCFGKLFLPLLAVSSALLFGGILSPFMIDYAKGLLYILPLGPGLTLIYLFFNNYLRPPENFDTKKYFCKLLVLMGLVCAVQIGYLFYHCYVLDSDVFIPSELGWANVNGVAALMLLCIPASCYLLIKTDKTVFWLAIILLFYFTIYLTKSDTALGVSVIFMPFMVYFVYQKLPKSRKQLFFNLFCIIFACLCLGAIILTCTGHLQKMIDKVTSALNSDSGRSPLFRDAVNVFLENPIFGGGMGYFNDLVLESHSEGYRHFNFHSTLFTILGCMGVAGVLAYVYYFFERFKVIMEVNTTFNLYMYFAFTMFSCHGFMDPVEFSTIPQMIVATLIILVTDLTNIKGNDQSLPLIFC